MKVLGVLEETLFKNKNVNADLENCVTFGHKIMMRKKVESKSQNLEENSLQNLSSKKLH